MMKQLKDLIHGAKQVWINPSETIVLVLGMVLTLGIPSNESAL